MKSQNLLMMFKLPGLLFILAITALPGTSWAALPARMTITGETQGVIQGELADGTIEVFGFGHNVSAAYDEATGLPTGVRQHRPIRVLKNIDLATPLLHNVLVNGEKLLNVTIRFYRPDFAGAEENFYTITLTDAHIVGIMPSHSSTEADIAVPDREVVNFTYVNIQWTFESGATSTDDWAEPTP